jgi:2-polyprenyl-3-methyl-5-hydroxy-6-metoxy-1,4-benzoquinol methylase
MNDRDNIPTDWMKYHYEVEQDYAQKILSSPKNSEYRSQLFAEGYDAIAKIMNEYDPNGGETDHTDVVITIINRLLKKGSFIFDIGCATANSIEKLLIDGYRAKGIDVSSNAIEQAKVKLQSYSLEPLVRQSDIMQYYPDETYDCIIMDNVIEHFHSDTIVDVLKKSYSLLNRNGYIIIVTPHKFSGPHDISGQFLPIGSKATGFHLKEFSFTDLYNDLKAAGFQQVFGFPFHPRLLRRFNIVPNSSAWAAQKAMLFEKVVQNSFLSKALILNGTLSRILVALLFPAVCVAKKEEV